MAAPTDNYVRAARLIRVIDGDTIVLDIDQGSHSHLFKSVRIIGINCPDNENPAGKKAATAATTAWLAGATLTVATQLDSDDKYGRLLGTIYRNGEDETLNAYLVRMGYAKAYDGRGARV